MKNNDHKCGNPNCVNPEHLDMETQKDNDHKCGDPNCVNPEHLDMRTPKCNADMIKNHRFTFEHRIK